MQYHTETFSKKIELLMIKHIYEVDSSQSNESLYTMMHAASMINVSYGLLSSIFNFGRKGLLKYHIQLKIVTKTNKMREIYNYGNKRNDKTFDYQ